mmetsp:Transcript_5696/g.12595  ORF Transcript_5696/g.12595 Transcript_5696/m.12595 type:complete len:329 (-) Transcript_5696:122-1108(-)|eukprot:CAMPEP_0202891026 /NCGR_PEP_ID=MMETSP1392-20130828/1224_1 /ASSEMBLY_ACC=CAM_ASM_000868 /TAXON_ID=225041 /ORGANISM="Chlamydomonas chlamydogama, Strain SAG 11-48b" /LENGTH=328 /DNA_ID=CAMNT_0049574691 /DNA_START=237 /DNA_END=1223 /DNA_ORIENTATION=-
MTVRRTLPVIAKLLSKNYEYASHFSSASAVRQLVASAGPSNQVLVTLACRAVANQQPRNPGLLCQEHGLLQYKARVGQSWASTTLLPHASQLSTHTQPAANDMWNIPNSLSIARAVSGPFIAYLVMLEQWPAAAAAVAVSGATDWLDGYLARKWSLQSVLGSYLDPLGDKVLVCCVVGALAYKALIPTWVAATIVGRDVALVGGMFVHRANMLGWRLSSVREFFQTQDAAAGPASGATAHLPAADRGTSGPGPAPAAPGAGGVPYMRPLMISKVNTVLQLSLITACLSQAWMSWPEPSALQVLEVTTVGTTAASCAAYAHKYIRGKLL